MGKTGIASGNRTTGTSRACVSRQGKQRRGRAGRRSRPKGACVVIFHVRDLKPVEKLVDGLHSSWERSRGKRGRRPPAGAPSAKGGHAHAAAHPPLFMPDEDHLIALAPSRPDGVSIRRAIERVLGEAVEHVQTRFVKAPKAKTAGPAPRRRP